MPEEEFQGLLDEQFSKAFRELCRNAIDLCVNVGIISSMMPRWPADVQQNWIEELNNMGERMNDEIRNVQEFASSFD